MNSTHRSSNFAEIINHKNIHCLDVSGGKVEKDIRDLLTAAVSKRMMGVRRIGCLLSGGLDSSLIAALVCKLCKEWGIDYKIQTFSIGMAGSPDIIAAKKVNRKPAPCLPVSK